MLGTACAPKKNGSADSPPGWTPSANLTGGQQLHDTALDSTSTTPGTLSVLPSAHPSPVFTTSAGVIVAASAGGGAASTWTLGAAPPVLLPTQPMAVTEGRKGRRGQ